METNVHEISMTHLEWAEGVCALHAAAHALRLLPTFSGSPVIAVMATGLDDLRHILGRAL